MFRQCATLGIAALLVITTACQTSPPPDGEPHASRSVTSAAPVDPPHEAQPRSSVESSPARPIAAVASSTWTPAEKTQVSQLASLFATGKAPEDAKFLEGRDPRGVPKMPRDPGSKGLDGDELVGRPLPMTRFIGSNGDVVDLNDWKGKKNVVLVILRGFSGAVCLSCTGQTLAINENLEQFVERDAEVFFVYPGPRDGVSRFVDAVSDIRGSREALPVELLLDIDLRVVREFKIEGKLAKPTTIILDKRGIVRFAHVGRTNTDRPTVPAMLEALARMTADAP